jgi:hypothetical protein
MNDLEAFAKLVQALAPWRQQLIFIGGWGHRLHRLDPRANQPAFANKEPLEGDIKQSLLEYGFQEELSGDHRPPAASYTLGDEGHGFYAEFLTPLIGSGRSRNGTADATMAAAGITAQKIRHLDVLLVDPWVINVGQQVGVPLPNHMDVQVTNPLCFMVQKFLIQSSRPAKKRAQDVLYIFDTIELFGALIEDFSAQWKARVAPALGRQADEVRRLSAQTFAEVNDMIRDAARIPADRELAPEQIQLTCNYAFETILRG